MFLSVLAKALVTSVYSLFLLRVIGERYHTCPVCFLSSFHANNDRLTTVSDINSRYSIDLMCYEISERRILIRLKNAKALFLFYLLVILTAKSIHIENDDTDKDFRFVICVVTNLQFSFRCQRSLFESG